MTTAHERLADILLSCGTSRSVLPPTMLYNEGWMLRLVLNWFAEHRVSIHSLGFLEGARWYSEALLSSQFRARYRGDELAEAWTHADGVIGHFQIRAGRGDIALNQHARQLVVTEAKMFSGLSAGTKRAVSFDQAARNVACIAEAIYAARMNPDDFERLGFVVLAPAEQIDRAIFVPSCDKASIAEKARARVAAYDGAKDDWYSNAFMPTLERVTIDVLSWESVIDDIARTDEPTGAGLRAFLESCIQFNRPRALTS